MIGYLTLFDSASSKHGGFGNALECTMPLALYPSKSLAQASLNSHLHPNADIKHIKTVQAVAKALVAALHRCLAFTLWIHSRNSGTTSHRLRPQACRSLGGRKKRSEASRSSRAGGIDRTLLHGGFNLPRSMNIIFTGVVHDCRHLEVCFRCS